MACYKPLFVAGIRTTYDVFLSFNTADRDQVRQVAAYLKDDAGIEPWFDDWTLIPGQSVVDNLHEGLRASQCCAVFIGSSGQGPWQQAEVQSALRNQRANPDFRVIPVLLPGAPLVPTLPSFLDNNLWVDFREGLDDDDARWRFECGIRGEAPGRGRPAQGPRPSPDAPAEHAAAIPGGPLDPESDYYVERYTDADVFAKVLTRRALVRLRGPRQSGKTSLMRRVHRDLVGVERRIRTTFIDLRALPEESLSSVSAIWQVIAEAVADQLGLDRPRWRFERSDAENLDRFLDLQVFEAVGAPPLLLCIDGIDRILGHDLQPELFSAIRFL